MLTIIIYNVHRLECMRSSDKGYAWTIFHPYQSIFQPMVLSSILNVDAHHKMLVIDVRDQSS